MPVCGLDGAVLRSDNASCQVQPDPEAVREELADVLNYCVQLSEKLGLDMDEILLSKLTKNAAKYPVEKDRGRNTKYTDL